MRLNLSGFSTTGFFFIYSLVEKGRLQVCLMEVTEMKSDKDKTCDTNRHASLHDEVENKHEIICMCSWGNSLQREHTVQTQHIIPACMHLCAWRTVLLYVSRMWPHERTAWVICSSVVALSGSAFQQGLITPLTHKHAACKDTPLQ